MEAKNVLSKAISLIPTEEHISTRIFTLFDNNLYFIGDKSWFKISNFIESNINFVIGYQHLQTVVEITGNIHTSVVDNFNNGATIKFSNDKHDLTINCNTINDPPIFPVAIPQPDDFENIPPGILLSKNLIDMIGKGSILSTSIIENKNCTSIISNNMVAAIVNDSKTNIDMTPIASIIKSSIINSARTKIDDNVIHFLLEIDNIKIQSGTRISPSFMSDRAKNTLSKAINKNLMSNIENENIEIKIDASSLSTILPIVDKLTHSGYMNVTVENNKMNIEIKDFLQTKFDTRIDCVCSNNINFKTNIITRDMIKFLHTGCKKNSKVVINMMLNVKNNIIVISKEGPPTLFIIMKISTILI